MIEKGEEIKIIDNKKDLELQSKVLRMEIQEQYNETKEKWIFTGKKAVVILIAFWFTYKLVTLFGKKNIIPNILKNTSESNGLVNTKEKPWSIINQIKSYVISYLLFWAKKQLLQILNEQLVDKKNKP